MPSPFRLKGAPEAQIQSGVCQLLAMHQDVAWAARTNSGGLMNKNDQWVWFVKALIGNGRFVGWVDIMGQMSNGLTLALECKPEGEWPHEALMQRWIDRAPSRRDKRQQRIIDQYVHIARCHHYGGHAGVVCSPTDALEVVEQRAPLGLYGSIDWRTIG